jgi:hypothetical protein
MRAHAGIVPAEQETMRSMSLRVVQPASDCAVLIRDRKLAAGQTRRPTAVMGLQAQTVIGFGGGQFEQPRRIGLGSTRTSRAGIRLP